MGQEPEQLRAEIARTRSELDQDLNLLTEKVSPGAIAERRVAATKGALTSVKDRVMGATQSTAGSAGGAVSDAAGGAASAVGSAPAAVKEQATGNPLAAGLIAFGAGWLLSSLLPASQAETKAAAQVKDAVAEPVKEQLTLAVAEAKDELAPAAQQAAASLQGTATDAVDAVKEQAADAAETVKEQAADSAGTVKDQAREAKDQVQGAGGSASPADAGPATSPAVVVPPAPTGWAADPLTAPLPHGS